MGEVMPLLALVGFLAAVVVGCVLGLFVWVILKFRRGELQARSPRSESRFHSSQDDAYSWTDTWSSGGSDHTGSS
ncbi:hypothetical protein [Nocardioides pantholopis]|uniref:hypothetical protein n=1 Tax=Nocardioides pantholopis TaxID=2483798 RepID=UPI000F08CF7F|nr:hypothetical protein [Nocardioides pantholopis]